MDIGYLLFAKSLFLMNLSFHGYTIEWQMNKSEVKGIEKMAERERERERERIITYKILHHFLSAALIFLDLRLLIANEKQKSLLGIVFLLERKKFWHRSMR